MIDQDFVARMHMCSEIVGNVSALARVSGISQSGIRKYFLGTEPTRLVLLGISRGAGVSLKWLMCGVGPICELDSPVLKSAKQSIVKDFEHLRGRGELQGLVLIDAGNQYCDNYNVGMLNDSLPEWIAVVIQKLYWSELSRWFRGDFSVHPKTLLAESGHNVAGDDDLVKAPAELLVTIARELPSLSGELYSDVERKRDVYVLKLVLAFLRKQSSDGRQEFSTPEMLRLQIQLAAHLFDQRESERSLGES